MSNEFAFSIKRIRFDENYRPSDNTRITTNFANLARGERREENLRNTLTMIDNRFNALAHWDNPKADRYSIELDIISVDIDVEGNGETFPINVLKALLATIFPLMCAIMTLVSYCQNITRIKPNLACQKTMASFMVKSLSLF